MRIIAQVSLRCIRNGFLTGSRFQAPHLIKSLSTNAPSGNWIGDNKSSNSVESADDFEQRIFGGNYGGNSRSESFFRKLDRLAKGRGGSGSRTKEQNSSEMDGLYENFNTLEDGMDKMLKKAAEDFEEDGETSEEEFVFRPDANFEDGDTYEMKDLDLTKPFVRRPVRRDEFCITTEEVLSKADFRNVRFLANFITDAGIIIKRSQTGISAKAQRKVAREIKTARALGLMPFTTMGTKSFVFGRSMESGDADYQSMTFGRLVDDGKEDDEA